MRLIVGLGNPGKNYESTRHNVGFMTIDKVAEHFNAEFRLESKLKGMITSVVYKGEKTFLLKPMTYMNLSGDAVVKYLNFYKIDVSDMVVIQDDLDMPLGNIKLLFNRGDGGHNGIKDIVLKSGSRNFLRVKIGIGKSNLIDTKDYVLGEFTSNDKEIINSVFFEIRDIVNDYVNFNTDKLI